MSCFKFIIVQPIQLLGLDTSVLNGELPEIIVIGVPSGANGTACPSPDVCSQRLFEYTHTVCDPTAQTSGSCEGSMPSGGGYVRPDSVMLMQHVVRILLQLQHTYPFP
jgi:hypothetical protein